MKHFYHLYGVLFDQEVASVPKSAIIEALNAEGVPFTGGYPHPLYHNPLFQERLAYGTEGCPFTCHHQHGREVDYRQVFHPVTEALCFHRAIWTNMIRPPLGVKDMKLVVNAVEKVFDHLPALREYAIEIGSRA